MGGHEPRVEVLALGADGPLSPMRTFEIYEDVQPVREALRPPSQDRPVSNSAPTCSTSRASRRSMSTAGCISFHHFQTSALVDLHGGARPARGEPGYSAMVGDTFEADVRGCTRDRCVLVLVDRPRLNEDYEP